MGAIFEASDIVAMAVRVEQNGWKFYNTFQETLESESAKEIFKFLAGEEKKHETIFKGLLGDLGQYRPPEAYEEEYNLYMQALADSHIFKEDTAVEEIARAAKTIIEALDVGIGFEKDSILFFNELLNFVPKGQHPVIQKLIDEEKGHLLKLSKLKKEA